MSRKNSPSEGDVRVKNKIDKISNFSNKFRGKEQYISSKANICQDDHNIMKSSEEMNSIFSAFSFQRPEPRIELDYGSAYTLLIAVVLSAQSTDVQVNKVTPRLFAVAKTPEDIVKLGVNGVKELIKSLGLYNNKAKSIVALSQMLLDDFAGQVPGTLEELLRLPGVGTKSARVMLNVVFGQSTVAVDTHAFRVSNRMGLCRTKSAQETEEILEEVIPELWRRNAHHWLVLHGRYVCKAIKPQCAECVVSAWCNYFLDGVKE